MAANGGTIEDLDDWLLKLDNLQKALKSCSSIHPRRMPSPLVSASEKLDDLYCRSLQESHPQSPPNISLQRRNPLPPLRTVFPSADPLRRKFCFSSPAHHCLPDGQFVISDRPNAEYSSDPNETQSSTDHQLPKLKTVRWSSKPAVDRFNGIHKFVSDPDTVESDNDNFALRYLRTVNHRGLNSSDTSEIPPPLAFTNGNNCDGNYLLHTQAISYQNHAAPQGQQIVSPKMQHPLAVQIQNGTSITPDRSLTQSLMTCSTLTRERSPQPNDWMGNLHFWKSLQNRESIDFLNSRTQGTAESDRKVILRVHQPDRTTKAVYVQSQTDAGEVVLMLAAKNFLPLSTKMALVEKVPTMKLERCFEDDEPVRDCILSWPVDNKNLIFFEERHDLFGLFEDTQTWLGNTLMGETAQMKNSLLTDILEKGGSNRLPPFKDYLYILQPDNKWKRRYCVLRSSGLYSSKKPNSDISELVRVTAFGEHLHLYTTSGGWLKDNTPTPYGFVLKPHSVVTTDPHMVRAFCAANEESLRIWCSLLRIILLGPRLLQSYRQRLAACALNYQLPINDGATDDDDEVLVPLAGAADEMSVNHLAKRVRHKYALESSVYSGAGVRESARQYAKLPAIARARSVSQILAHISNRQASLNCSQVSLGPYDRIGASVSDLGFVSGRTDVGRTASMNELCADEHKATISSTQSLHANQQLASSINPLRWPRKNMHEAATPQPLRRSTTRKGPAERKCNRSTSNLHRPPSISPSSSVFFLPPAEEMSAKPPVVMIEENHNTLNRQNEQLQSHQPMLMCPGQRIAPVTQTPQSPRHSNSFAGVRPQLLPSQLSPAAF